MLISDDTTVDNLTLPKNRQPMTARRHCCYYYEFVVGSLLCSERFFPGYSGFPLSSKTNIFKFQFDLECADTSERVLVNSLVLRG